MFSVESYKIFHILFKTFGFIKKINLEKIVVNFGYIRHCEVTLRNMLVN